MVDVDEGDRHRPRARPDVPAGLLPAKGDDDPPPSSDDGDEVCPYQGLAPFEADRTAFFFGRTQATHGLLERLGSRLREHGTILQVSGASGVGKSSMLRAGLMPALAEGMLPVAGSQGWPRLLITPTSRPLRALADGWTEAFGGRAETVHEQLRDDPRRALSGALSSGRFILVVDQFEELFTLVTDERERRAFVQVLHAMTAEPPGAGVIIGVRADYWDRCAAYPQFAESIQDGQIIVEPMTESDLRLAITGPAATVGLEIEPGLVETILGELRADRAAEDRYEAGALPLLSQALRNTWERREDGRLTVRGYERSGRVRDSVRRTADQVLERLPVEERKTALRVLRRMTLIGAGGRLARRRVTLAEIHAAASAHSAERRGRVEALLSAFADRRLLTLHEDTAEIAHEALLTAWPALRQWLDPDLTAQAVYDRLIEDASQWAGHHRDPAFLYRGARLLSVDDSRPRWDRDPDSFPPPGPTVEGFLAASTRAARRAGRRRGIVTACLAVLAVLALIAAGIAVDAANDADRQRRLAVSRQLAAQSEVVGDPATSSLLALAAWRVAPTPEARYRLLNAAANPGRGTLGGHRRPVTELMFSPDGSIIATGSDDGAVRLWDTASRRPLGAPITDTKSVLTSCSTGFSAAFSPDGKVLATACFRFIRLWDVSTRRPLGGYFVDPIGSVQAMAFSPDGRTLATSTYEGVTRLWDVATRHRIGKPFGGPRRTAGNRAVKAVAFSPDGKRLVTAGADKTARLWDTATYRQIGRVFSGHTDDIHDISLSPDGTTLATASTDGTARLWNLATQHQIGGSLRDPDRDRPPRGFRGIAFGPDGKRLATAGPNGVRLWDTTGHRPVGPALADKRQPAGRVAFSPDGKVVVAAGDEGVAWLWDATAHRQVGAAMPAASDVAFSPDAKTLAAPGPGRADRTDKDGDRMVRLWDVATQREVGRRLRPEGGRAAGPDSRVFQMRFGSDGRTLTTTSAGGDVRVWDVAKRRQIGPPRYSARNSPIVEVSPDGRLLALRTWGDSLVFWDMAQRRESGPRITIPGFTDNISELEFGPRGAMLAVAGRDRSVRLFDMATRRQVGSPMPGTSSGGFIDDLAFTSDGKILATTAADATIRLWDVAAHRQIGTPLRGHSQSVTALAFSPDGKTLVSASADRTVRLWDLLTHRQIGPPLTGHTKYVTKVAYSPDGTTVATVGEDETARLWNVPVPADLTTATCANAGRSLTLAEWRRYVPSEKFQRVCK